MSELSSLAVWHRADLLVLGSTMAAVSAALAAREAGLKVVLVGEETSLGQDLGGDLHLWEESSTDRLVSECLATGDGFSARPTGLKRALERLLLKAGIPLLFGVRPVSLLFDEQARVMGAVLVARTSLFTVVAAQVIDATPFGLGLRLAGTPMVSREPTPDVLWRILAQAPPACWSGSTRELPAYRQSLEEGPREFRAFELGASRHDLGLDMRETAHRMRAGLVDERVLFTADNLIDAGTEMLRPTGSLKSIEQMGRDDLQIKSGLWHATRLLPVADPSELTDPSRMSSLGRRVGVMAAENRRDCPATGSCSASVGVVGQSLSFCEAFLRAPQGVLQVRDLAFPEWGACDVAIAGGGTGGAPAAIAAARAGARTICLEAGHTLGGVGTTGLISSYWFGNKTGFTTELDGAVSEVVSLSRTKRGNSWRPETKSAVYHRMLQDAGGTAWMGSFVFGVQMSGNRPTGVLVSTPFGCGFLHAQSFVDATGNADLAAACGAPVRVIKHDHVAVQGTGISPRFDPSVSQQNSDHTFIDENDPEGITAAHIQAREKYPESFETAPFVNSRERRQIVGEYEVSPLDILAERTFPDTVFTARSNFDTHGFIVHPVFMVAPPDHQPLQADVPLRCMIPQGVEGVLVTGLGMSAHRDALPVIRMQADVQNQGYAAGLLSALTAKSGEPLRQIDVKAFQRRLVEIGILTPETAGTDDSFPLPSSAIAKAARGELKQAREVAILFSNPAAARRELLPVLQGDPTDERHHRAALILGFMGFPEAGPTLRRNLENKGWDEGWNFRGMEQFGACMSPLDAQIIALGRTKDPDAGSVLARLAEQLDSEAAFSHGRAIALAAASLRSPDLTRALERLLRLPGFRGHSAATVSRLLEDSDHDTTSTRSRNLALREIYVARGLFLCGDSNGIGRSILEEYSQDLRGHFAQHARAVLARGQVITADLPGI